MNVNCVIDRTVRLAEPTRKVQLPMPLAYNNALAHAFRVTVVDEQGEAVDLSGVGCAGAMLNAHGRTVSPIIGTVSGNTAEVVLPESCYVVPGHFSFTMNLTKPTSTEGIDAFSTSVNYAKNDLVVYNGVVYRFTAAHTAGAWTGTDVVADAASRTIMWVDGFVEQNVTESIVDPGTPVDNITTAIAQASGAATAATAATVEAQAAALAAGIAASNITSALSLTTGGVIQMGWESGGMYDATGIEYASTTQCRSGFLAVDNTCNFRVVTDATISSRPQIFEFKTNDTTTSSVNVRSSKNSHYFDKPVGVMATTNYIRIAFNEPLSNVQGHVFIIKTYIDSLKGYEADEAASVAETGCGFLHGIFVNQGLWHGGLTGTAPWRVSTNKIFQFDHDVTLRPSNSVQIAAAYFDSSSAWTSDSPWSTDPLTIPAGTRFKLTTQGTAASGYGDIILTLKSILVESVTHEKLAEVDELNVKAAASTITNSASGAEVVITDGADGLALQAMTLDFKPTQTGSGDPSPTNVRTITGLTGVTISRSGADTTDADETEVSWTGTVFGGQVDVTGGTLTETYREYTLDGTVSPGTISTSGNHIRFWVGLTGAKFYGGDPYCDQLKEGAYNTAEDYTCGYPSSYPNCLFAWLPYGVTGGVQEATAASIKAWLAEHPIQVVTTLATPATQSITPAEITTVRGENHIWADGTTITECVYCADATITADKLSKIPRNLPRYAYTGERFAAQHSYAVEKLFQLTDEYPIVGPDGKNRTRQGGACFGDYLFVTYNGFEHISVYQVSTGTHLQEIEISSTFREGVHANNMSFGPERYADTDEFPLLYVSADANNGLCEVYRIQRSGTSFSATLVQTITFPLLIDGLGANCFVDGENRKLWVEGHTTNSVPGGPTTKHRFARYELPWLSEGNVTISASDKQAGFDIPTYSAYQDGVVRAGKYMQAYGYGTSADLLQIDLLGGGVTGRVNLWDIGLTEEPESAFIWNGYLCYYTVFGAVYKLYFD